VSERRSSTSCDERYGAISLLAPGSGALPAGRRWHSLLHDYCGGFTWVPITSNDLSTTAGYCEGHPDSDSGSRDDPAPRTARVAGLLTAFPIFHAGRPDARPVVPTGARSVRDSARPTHPRTSRPWQRPSDASCVYPHGGAAASGSSRWSSSIQVPYETAVGDAGDADRDPPADPAGGSSAYAPGRLRAGDWAVVSVGAAFCMADVVITTLASAWRRFCPIPLAFHDLGCSSRQGSRPRAVRRGPGRIAAESCRPVTAMRGHASYKLHLVR